VHVGQGRGMGREFAALTALWENRLGVGEDFLNAALALIALCALHGHQRVSVCWVHIPTLIMLSKSSLWRKTINLG
jgi:hypothetical protein